jgi:hypothetical protein
VDGALTLRGKAPSIMTASAPPKATLASPVQTTPWQTETKGTSQIKSPLFQVYKDTLHDTDLEEGVGGILELHLHSVEGGLDSLRREEERRVKLNERRAKQGKQ